jgi:quercetin dioxygenase-like cupin family protein
MAVQLDEAHGVVSGPGEGESLSAAKLYLVKGGLPDLALFESMLEPGDAISPHLHREHADAFYVLEGELEVTVGSQTVLLGAGGLMAAPPGVVHAVRNPGSLAERHLNLHAPGSAFLALARARARGERVDSAEYDSFGPEGGEGEGIVSPAGEGERLASGVRTAFVKAELPQLSVFDFHLDGPFEGPEPHTHSDHTDSFYVLEGEAEFAVEGRTFAGGPGTFVSAPPGVEHTFGKPRSGYARLLNVHAPDAGFTDSLRGMSSGVGSAEPPKSEGAGSAGAGAGR